MFLCFCVVDVCVCSFVLCLLIWYMLFCIACLYYFVVVLFVRFMLVCGFACLCYVVWCCVCLCSFFSEWTYLMCVVLCLFCVVVCCCRLLGLDCSVGCVWFMFGLV